ncbi:hypothetical protein EIN_234440 [Entamoeba invadens IP1]|uniref:Leucine rich repeat containing protein BspA family protein n=1 Tax=Entamoeba invadens IP1 TaxID=370355 RepID=L7FKP2_ENTIV|nr:hypothetical protein EIN_234440 [Entamoeba invadens IP1]ELP86007.1 hypothetical protein EIN_234440 [Entamoeba invadens IP1]|eukprot:XP_004185353.1 hypothetical protein EIN_234440 [Entamoeba invadens IP1]
MTEEDCGIFNKIKLFFKVMFLSVSHMDTFNMWNIPISFWNFHKSITLNEKEIPFIQKYSHLVLYTFDSIIIWKWSCEDLDLSDLNCMSIEINNTDHKEFTVQIRTTVKRVKTDSLKEIHFFCSQEIEIEVLKKMDYNTLCPTKMTDFFELPPNYDIIIEEREYNRRLLKCPESLLNLPEFVKMSPDEQFNYRVFVNLVADLEVLELVTHGTPVREKHIISPTKTVISDQVDMANLSFVNVSFDCFDFAKLPTSLTSIKLSNLYNQPINLAVVVLKEITCDYCRNINITLNTALKSIDLNECYKVFFNSPQGAVYLTHFDSYHTYHTSGKNIVVDYLIPYKEKCEQGPCWADSVAEGFNYIKGMVYTTPGFSSSENGYWCEDPLGIPTKPANILAHRTCYKKDIVYIWFRAIKDIGDFCFCECNFKSRPKIELSDELTHLGIGAFSGAINLESVRLPVGLTKLPYKAFYNVTSLTEIKTNETQIEIDDFTLYGCSKLEKYPKFVVAKGANYSDKFLIKFCELKNIEIGREVTKLWKRSFADCTTLTEIKIPQSVLFVDDLSFVGCSNLQNILFDENVVLGKHLCFANLVNLVNIKLPTTLTKIRNFMFKNCVSLLNIQIPSSVIQIEDMAFYGCRSLQYFVVPLTVKSVGLMCFKDCTSLSSLSCCVSLQLPKSTLMGTNALITHF